MPRTLWTTEEFKLKEKPWGKFTVFEAVSKCSANHKNRFLGTNEQER